MRADFSLDYDVITVEQPQKLYLMARFEAGESVGDGVRRPLNLSLVIDRSGSMAGDKIDYTRQAAQFLVQHLSPQDTLSIVLYNDRVETLLPPEKITHKDRISQLLERLRVRGTTNLSGGWLEGCQHVATNLNPSTLNRVILMSDGQANRGVTDIPTLVSLARKKREEGVSTTTMGLGKDFNEDLLMEMASAAGGAFYFIESPEVAPDIFNEELIGLLNVVGQNLIISIDPGEPVQNIRQLNAYPMSKKGKKTEYRLGDIFASEVKTLVIELSIPSLEDLGEQQIALLRFEYDEIEGNTTQHHVKEMPVMINVKADQEPHPLPDPTVTQTVLLLRAARARQDAVRAADSGDYVSASETLREVAKAIEKTKLNDQSLKEERQALLEQAEQLDRGASAYNKYSRKTMSTQALYTLTSRHEDTVMLREREHQRKSQSEAKRETLDRGIPAISIEGDEKDTLVKKQPGISPTHLSWQGQRYEIKGDIVRLGRSSHNEIVINDRGVSRFHAHIRREDGRLMFEDLGSTNGSTIEGRKITAPIELSVGDIIFLCDAKLTFGIESDG